MPKRGMPVQRVGSGIESMLGTINSGRISFPWCAKNVVRNLQALSITNSSALTHVKPKADTRKESTTQLSNVRCAESHLSKTNMSSEERVQKIVGCNYPEKRKVFDIEVEYDHCYYANGLLVSNSDALRYLVVGLDACLAEGQSMTDAQAEALYRQYVRR